MDLREQILAASVELITQEGIGGLSMREVARRAGVSHQAPYHHFPDRSAILAAIAGDGFSKLALELEEVISSGKGNAQAKLDAGGRAYVRFATAHPGHFRVMFRPELVELSEYPEAQDAAKRAFAALEALVGGVVADGVVDAKLASGTVTLCWAVVHGLASLLLDGPLVKAAEDGDPNELADAALDVFRRLLARPAGKKKRAPA